MGKGIPAVAALMASAMLPLTYAGRASAATTAATPTATITSITLETRQAPGTLPGTASASFPTYFNSLPVGQPGYTKTPLQLSKYDSISNSPNVAGGSMQNIAYHVQVKFTTPKDGEFKAQFGMDFGYGGVAIMDGTTYSLISRDIMFQGDWTKSFSITANTVAGAHVIDIYGVENCCDSPSSARYSYLGSAWTTLQK